jgi:hypothetical protein
MLAAITRKDFVWALTWLGRDLRRARAIGLRCSGSFYLAGLTPMPERAAFLRIMIPWPGRSEAAWTIVSVRECLSVSARLIICKRVWEIRFSTICGLERGLSCTSAHRDSARPIFDCRADKMPALQEKSRSLIPRSKARLEAVPWTRFCRECKESEQT